MPSVPAVPATLTDLAQAFTERCGVGEESIRVLRDPATPTDFGLALAETAEQAEDVLWLHFVGHGLVSPAGELYLATAATDLRPGRLATSALPYAAVRDCLLQTPARSIVVTLDCCFAGRALGTLGDDEPEPVDLARVNGGVVLAAAARDELALAPAGFTHTAFSGALIQLLVEGDPDGPPRLTLRDAHRYLDRVLPAQGAPRPRRRASGWIDDLVLGPNPAYRASVPSEDVLPPEETGQCPYPGLAAFGPGQAQWFFGRERLTEELLRSVAQRVDEGSALMVIGASGAGKSSLLGAGLLPALANGRLPVPGSVTWPRIRMTPSEHPLEQLVNRLVLVGAVNPGDLAARLRAVPSVLATVLRDLLTARSPKHSARGARVVLVVDQFEEIFTLCRDDGERTAFVEALSAAADGGSGKEPCAVVVLGTRADVFGQCSGLPSLHRPLATPLVVGGMTGDELREAVERPAHATGLRLGEGLLDVLLRDLGTAPSADGPAEPGRLPHLAHALEVTWRHREGRALTLGGYRRAGGIDGAVATTAERTYESLDDAGQRAVHRIMLRLVKVGPEGQDALTRAAPTTLVGPTDSDGAASPTESALEGLVRARLVTRDADTVQITHEALLRAWPRLRAWIEEDRAGIALRQQVAEAAHTWQAAGRDPSHLLRGVRLEQAAAWTSDPAPGSEPTETERAYVEAGLADARRGIRRRRQLTGVLAGLLVLALVAATLAFIQRDAADTARDVSEARRLTALYKTSIAGAPADARLYAMAAYHDDPGLVEARSAILNAQTPFRITEGDATITGGDAMALSPDGRILATVSDTDDPSGGTVGLWSVRGQRLLRTLHGFLGKVDTVVYSADGHYIAAGSEDGTIHVWTAEGSPVHTFTVDNRAEQEYLLPHGLAFSPHDTALVWGDTAGTRYAPLTGGHVWTVAGSSLDGVPPADALSPDGRLLAAVSDGASDTILLWDTVRHDIVARLTEHHGAIDSYAFSPDGTQLAIGSQNRTVRLWNVATRRSTAVLHPPSKHDKPIIWELAFVMNGAVLLADDDLDRYYVNVRTRHVVRTVSRDPSLLMLSQDHTLLVTEEPSEDIMTGVVDVVTTADDKTLDTLQLPDIGRVNNALLNERTLVVAVYLSGPKGRLIHVAEILTLDPAQAFASACRATAHINRSTWQRLLPGVAYRSGCT